MMVFVRVMTAVAVCGLSWNVMAQSNSASESKPALESKSGLDAIAKVGKVVISTEKYEKRLKSEIQRGRVDSPQLREQVRNMLINQELLIQEVSRQGIDKKPMHREAVQRLRQNYLIEALFRENLAKNPVTDQEVRAIYEAEYLPKLPGTLEYKLKELAFSDEKTAFAALQRLKKGEAFDKLWAEQVGSKKLAENWVLQQRLAPAVSSVIVYISKGAYTLSPIQLGSRWFLIKVEDTRPYKAPDFEQVKSSIQASLVQRRNAALLQKLRSATTVSVSAK